VIGLFEFGADDLPVRFRIVAIDFDVMRILPHAERKNPEA
jgi:hypothetical protein